MVLNKRKTWKTGLLILTLCLLISNVTGATYDIEDNIQNHPSDSLSAYYENVVYTCPWTPSTAGTGGGGQAWVDIVNYPYSDTKVVRMSAWAGTSAHDAYTYLYSEKSTDKILYLSFVQKYSLCGAGSCIIIVYFYNSNDVEITHTSEIQSYIVVDDHVELLKSGDSIALYVNGVYKVSAASGVTEDIYSFMIQGPHKHVAGSGQYNTKYFDDITVNNYVIGTFPQNYSIKRYWENPASNGLYNNAGGKLYTHDFHTSYTYRNITSYEPADSIVTRYAFTNEIVNTTTISQSADMITYNLTSMLFHDDQYDDQYGLYKQQLMQGTSILAEDFFWFDFESALKPSNNSTITFDEETYVADETMTLTWHLEDTDFSKYDFKGCLYNTDTWEQKETWIISSNDGSEEIETTSGYTEGNYLALLRAESKSTSWSIDLDWDVAKVLKETLVEGVTYDAESGSALGSVNITYTQETTDYNATSEASTGTYNISGLAVGVSTDVNATKTNYTHNDFTFTPLIKGKYDIDLFLLPNASYINHTNASVGGLVLNYPFFQSVSDATVNLWKNSTWSTSTTTSDTGYYVFNDLPMNTTTITNETFNSSAYGSWIQLNYTNIALNSENVTNTTDETPFVLNTDYEMNYTDGKIKVLATGSMVNYTDYHIDYDYEVETTFYINATKGGLYTNSSTETITVTPKNYTYHYIILSQDYILSIYAKDIYASTTITSFTVILDDGTPQNTTTGVINFTVGYGYHKVEVSASGYTTVVDDKVYVDEDTEKTIYLTLIETVVEGGAGVYYPPPHLVRFFVQDIYGSPKQNVEVTTICIETTMGSWNWLYDIFGFKNETITQNTTMNGTTDSAGGISFIMVETIKYNLHFVNATQDIDETLTIYPKSDRYTVIVGRKPFFYLEPQLFGEEIVWNFTMEKVDGTDAWLNFTYNDTLGETTSGSYYIFTVNETTGIEKINLSNRTYYCSTPLYNMSSVWSYSCLVSDYRGNTYIMGFNATHTTAGEFEEAVSVFFRYNHPLISFEGWTDGYYQFLSIALLIFAGMLFTGVTIKIGAILLPLFAFLLFGIGWFSPTNDLVTSGILLGIATAIGAAAYITTSGREKNLAS